MNGFIVLLVGVAGCGPTLASATRDAEHDNADSDATFQRSLAEIGAPRAPRTKPVAVEGDGPTATVKDTTDATAVLTVAAKPGLSPGELFVHSPTGLLFVGGHCVVAGSCGGCGQHATYHVIAARDGHTIIVRERPVVHVTRVKVESCGYGCGTQMVEPAIHVFPALDLGAVSATAVEVRELAHHRWTVSEYCDHPVPAP